MKARGIELSKNMVLLLGSIVIVLIVGELWYRVFDPFPYIAPFEVNNTEHGNLSKYDKDLGWSGVPGAEGRLVTVNSAVTLQHNRVGYRDIEPELRLEGKPAIVFLGDSFTWGYEVEWDEMFVNRLRKYMKQYEIYNLAHRGYGTDQAFLTFRMWRRKDHDLALVILMFSENDIADNNNSFRYGKGKPKFEVRDDELVLTNVPVPYVNKYDLQTPSKGRPASALGWLKYYLLQSHLLHDVYYRIAEMHRKYGEPERKAIEGGGVRETHPDTVLTARILQRLRDEVAGAGATLAVIAIPSKKQVVGGGGVPYQEVVESMCKRLGISYYDLAPAMNGAFLRTYFRGGMHWNSRGHKVAAEAIFEYLVSRGYMD